MIESLQSGWRILRQSVKGASCVFIPLVSGFLILTSPTPVIVDANHNGMSDLWEKEFNNGELLSEIDPQGDADGDGKLNKDEAIAGTDPFSGIPPEGFLQPSISHAPAVWNDIDEDEIPDLIVPETMTVSLAHDSRQTKHAPLLARSLIRKLAGARGPIRCQRRDRRIRLHHARCRQTVLPGGCQ